jgi:CheY-like chemotaxis protein
MEHSTVKHRAGDLGSTLRERGEQLSGIHILVAEDNRINQQVVKEFLQLSGIKVDIANNGNEALEKLESHTYSAVLMDVNMPVMGGVEATERIRSQSRFAALPVIALTAGVTQQERDSCLACGMNDFVTKPINPQELIGVLCKWI